MGNELGPQKGIVRKIFIDKRIMTLLSFIILTAALLNIFVNIAVNAQTQNTKYIMSYIYFGTTQKQIENVLITNNALSAVSPSYFDLNRDGSLKLNNISTEFISAMKQQGVKIVPFLSNHWDRETGIAALNNIEGLSNSIVAAINTYNLDGVNIDIENVTQTEREKYTQLVAALRQKLSSDKEVSVAAAANPYNWTTGWQGSYDYAALSDYADHILIMAYDEHYSGGDMGPVASIGFVEKSIQYAAKYVPKEKIVLGIPFFGRVWSQDGSMKGLGVSLDRIPEIMQNYEYTITYDDVYKSPKMEFIIKPNDQAFVVNNITFKAGRYTLGYENDDSIKEKLALVAKYDLKGAGNWSAGQETQDVWGYYKNWINGIYFNDISSCFAKDDIINLSVQGIIKGLSQTEFAPNQTLTRAQAAAIISRVLNLEVIAQDEITYSDIKTHWAKNEIEAATRAGILYGYEDNSFMPDSMISRAEMAAIIARMLNVTYDISLQNVFTDINNTYWAYNDILSLSKLGIISGYQDKSFKPNSQITRAEGAALINRAISMLN